MARPGCISQTREGDPGFQVPRPLVPLRVSARSLVARRELGWTKALAAAATAELHLGTELDAETISTPVAGASWLILVDASMRSLNRRLP